MSPQQVALIAAGALYLVVGVLAFLVPGTFYSELAAFPPENDHFVRDLGTWNVGLGIAALYAAQRESWRRPMLWIVAVQYALHTVSHVIDAGETSPEWQSWFALALFAVGTVVLAALAALAPRERAHPAAVGDVDD